MSFKDEEEISAAALLLLVACLNDVINILTFDAKIKKTKTLGKTVAEV